MGGMRAGGVAAGVVAVGAIGYLGWTVYALGNRPERVAPVRVVRDQGPDGGGEERRERVALGGAAAAAQPVERTWAATGGGAAGAEAALSDLSNRVALAGASAAGTGVLAARLGENIRTILAPLVKGKGEELRATLGQLGAQPPGAGAAGEGSAPRAPTPPPGGNPIFKALAGAQLDLANARVRRLTAAEMKAGPMAGRRRGGGSPEPEGEDFGAVVAAGFRGAFPEAEKGIEAGTALAVEVSVPLLIDGATDPDPNARVSFKMVYDKAADAWQPLMLALGLKDPSVLKKFAPSGGE